MYAHTLAVLALLGAIASGTATWQHRRFCRTLAAHELPRNYRVSPGLALGFGVAVAGLVVQGAVIEIECIAAARK